MNREPLNPWAPHEPRDVDLELYWRPGCLYCTMLRRGLAKAGVPVRPVNIWSDPAAAARVRAVAHGSETVPTVFLGEHALVAPDTRTVLELVSQHGPHLLVGTQPRESVRSHLIGSLRARRSGPHPRRGQLR